MDNKIRESDRTENYIRESNRRFGQRVNEGETEEYEEQSEGSFGRKRLYKTDKAAYSFVGASEQRTVNYGYRETGTGNYERSRRKAGQYDSFGTIYGERGEVISGSGTEAPEPELKGAASRLKVRKTSVKSKAKSFIDRIGKTAGNAVEKSVYAADYQGKQQLTPEEHSINQVEKGIKSFTAAAAVVAMAVVKAVMSFMTSLVGILIICTLLIVVSLISTLQVITHNFLLDEEKFIKGYIHQITSDFTDDMYTKQEDEKCSDIIVSGELADWKDIIAFWWSLKSVGTDEQQYNDFYEGEDIKDLEKLFYQFNDITYTVLESEDDDGNTVYTLKVSIVNNSIETLIEHWGLSWAQQEYIDELLEDDDLWEDLLSTDELSYIAYMQMGQSASNYEDWLYDGDDVSMAFFMWCLDYAGYIDNEFVTGTNSLTDFRSEMETDEWDDVEEISEGDIIVYNVSEGVDTVGIVSSIDNGTLYIVYLENELVEEMAVLNDSQKILAVYHLPKLLADPFEGVTKSGEFMWPADTYYVTSAFKYRWGRQHQGIDIAVSEGDPIYAAADGTVSAAAWSDSMGYYVLIVHDSSTSTIYMHNSKLLVTQGQSITAGDQIAEGGNTGNSTGPHCHFGVKVDGTYVDPAPLLGIPAGFEGDASSYF